MTAEALQYWQSTLAAQLDELEAIHTSATGAGPGRRWGTEHFNGTLYVALVGRFQHFCLDLHDEALDHLRRQGPIATVLAQHAATGRVLDKGNPSRSSLGSDFARLGLTLIDRLEDRPHGRGRLARLDAALTMRNGIAHGNANKVADAEAIGAAATLPAYRRHRSALNGLSVDMTTVVAHHLRTLTGGAPW